MITLNVWQLICVAVLSGLLGLGLAATMAYTFRMAAYAHAYVAERLKAWRAYDSERLEHEATRARLQSVEALCRPLGWDANERPLHEWLDQRFATERAEQRRLNRAAAEMLGGVELRDGVGFRNNAVQALTAHLAKKDKAS